MPEGGGGAAAAGGDAATQKSGPIPPSPFKVNPIPPSPFKVNPIPPSDDAAYANAEAEREQWVARFDEVGGCAVYMEAGEGPRFPGPRRMRVRL